MATRRMAAFNPLPVAQGLSAARDTVWDRWRFCVRRRPLVHAIRGLAFFPGGVIRLDSALQHTGVRHRHRRRKPLDFSLHLAVDL